MSDPNENRAGYKETKVGWIPEDWAVTRLSDVAMVNSETISEKSDPELEFYYVDLGAVRDGYFTLPDEKLCFSEAPSRARRQFKKGDVLLATVRPNLRGFGYVDFCSNQYICSTGFAVVRPVGETSGQYIFQSLFSPSTSRYFYGCVVGTGYPALNGNDVDLLPLALPCLREQEKIANILSTCDEGIEKTGALIDAKKRQKKVLMQQLLTGKKRLSEFVRGKGTTRTRTGDIPSDWEWTHLGKLFKKRVERSGDALPLMAITIDSGMVRRDSIERKVDSELTESDNLLARRGDIAYNTMRMWQGAVGVAEEDCHVSPAYVVCTPVEGVADSEFYYYWFKSAEGLHLLWSYSYGITGDRLRLYAADFSLVPAPLPSLEEQRAVVSVLRSAEEEIERLLQKQATLQQQKKSLMQKLLTGQVRVKV